MGRTIYDNVEDIMNKNVKELKKILKEKSTNSKDNIYDEWCYSNLRITMLEREFFTVFSKKEKGMTKTKILRIIIRSLMKMFPKYIPEAKDRVERINRGEELDD